MDQREHLREEVDRATESMAARVREIEHRAGEVKRQVKEAVSLDHHVRERPWVAVGSAVAAGCLVGFAFTGPSGSRGSLFDGVRKLAATAMTAASLARTYRIAKEELAASEHSVPELSAPELSAPP